MDLRKWGDGNIYFSENYSKAKIIRKGGKFKYLIDIKNNTYTVELRYIETGNILYKYTDILLKDYKISDLYDELLLKPEDEEEGDCVKTISKKKSSPCISKNSVSKIIVNNKTINRYSSDIDKNDICLDLSTVWKNISNNSNQGEGGKTNLNTPLAGAVLQLLKVNGKMSDINFTVFSRRIKNKIYYFSNGKVIFKKIIRKYSFLSQKKKDLEKTENFITMDLETKIDADDKMFPFCICFYDGNETTSFFTDNKLNSENLILTALNELLIEKYSNHVIYLHNFSYFDSIFLMKVMVQISDDISLVVRDGKIINKIYTYLLLKLN